MPRRWVTTLPAEFRFLLFMALSSAFSVALLTARVVYLQQPFFMFLIWNLFLAWIPFGAALLYWRGNMHTEARHTGWRRFGWELSLLSVWFLFFPNAPYIVTDFLHLKERVGIPLWFDLMLLLSFAWNGLLLGFVSLAIVQSVTERRWGSVWGFRLAVITLTASGFGIYAGRFLRWNSWDVLVRPEIIAGDLIHRLLHPMSHPRTFAVTLVFSCFLLISYGTLRMLACASWTKWGHGDQTRTR